jgi:acyl carrier protein
VSELQTHILEELNRIAKKELDFERRIEPAMSLKGDLKLDSMGMIIVAVGLENKFRVKLEEQDGGELATVSDLLALVERRVNEGGAAS